MTDITLKAQQLIERDNLGIPTEVYKPNIIGGIIIGIIVMAIGIGWSLVATFIINGFHIFMGSSSSPSIDPSSLPSIDPSALPSTSPSSGMDIFGTLTGIFGIVFPLFGLLFVVIGLIIFLKTILIRNNQAVVCTGGVAYVTRKSADAFRWEQVLLVFNKTYVSKSTTQNENGFTSNSTTVHHKYAVHCHDGRKFVFDDTLSHVEDLVERIELEVARQRAIVR